MPIDAALDELRAHRRMRASLETIRPLDPAGAAARIAEFDREIAHLEALLGPDAAKAAPRPPMEVVLIGSRRVRAA